MAASHQRPHTIREPSDLHSGPVQAESMHKGSGKCISGPHRIYNVHGMPCSLYILFICKHGAAAVSERHAHCAPSIPLDAFAAERLGVRGKSGKFMDPIELLFIQLQDISAL